MPEQLARIRPARFGQRRAGLSNAVEGMLRVAGKSRGLTHSLIGGPEVGRVFVPRKNQVAGRLPDFLQQRRRRGVQLESQIALPSLPCLAANMQPDAIRGKVGPADLTNRADAFETA